MTFVTLFVISFGCTFGPITWLYNAEILPEKGAALTTTTLNWICMSIVISFFYFLGQDKMTGIFSIFMIFACINLFGIYYVAYHIKETKNLTMDQIKSRFLGIPFI